MDPRDDQLQGLSELWNDLRDDAEAAVLADEVRREVPPGHVLYEANFLVLAVHQRRKEVLLWMPECEQWAWTHLTWTAETDARWPSTTTFSTWTDLLAELVDAGRG